MCNLMSGQGKAAKLLAIICRQHNITCPDDSCTILPGWQVCLAARLLLRGPPLDAAGLDAWESAAWHTRQLGTVANDLGAGAALGISWGCSVCAMSRTLPDTHGRALPGMRSGVHAISERCLTSTAKVCGHLLGVEIIFGRRSSCAGT